MLINNVNYYLAAYEWKWNTKPEYAMPLLNDLADWRQKLKALEKEIENEDIGNCY